MALTSRGHRPSTREETLLEQRTREFKLLLNDLQEVSKRERTLTDRRNDIDRACNFADSELRARGDLLSAEMEKHLARVRAERKEAMNALLDWVKEHISS